MLGAWLGTGACQLVPCSYRWSNLERIGQPEAHLELQWEYSAPKLDMELMVFLPFLCV